MHPLFGAVAPSCSNEGFFFLIFWERWSLNESRWPMHLYNTCPSASSGSFLDEANASIPRPSKQTVYSPWLRLNVVSINNTKESQWHSAALVEVKFPLGQVWHAAGIAHQTLTVALKRSNGLCSRRTFQRTSHQIQIPTLIITSNNSTIGAFKYLHYIEVVAQRGVTCSYGKQTNNAAEVKQVVCVLWAGLLEMLISAH